MSDFEKYFHVLDDLVFWFALNLKYADLFQPLNKLEVVLENDLVRRKYFGKGFFWRFFNFPPEFI